MGRYQVQLCKIGDMTLYDVLDTQKNQTKHYSKAAYTKDGQPRYAAGSEEQRVAEELDRENDRTRELNDSHEHVIASCQSQYLNATRQLDRCKEQLKNLDKGALETLWTEHRQLEAAIASAPADLRYSARHQNCLRSFSHTNASNSDIVHMLFIQALAGTHCTCTLSAAES